MFSIRQISILFIIVFAVFFSCKKESNLPPQPAIKFLDFTQRPDSGFLRLSFTDGDGDINLSREDTNFNFFIRYFEKRGGTYSELFLRPPLNYRIRDINPTVQKKPLEGIIKVKWKAPYYNPFLRNGDTIRYDFYLVDIAGNTSNTETTGDIIIRK
jgi:hypothetical protein